VKIRRFPRPRVPWTPLIALVVSGCSLFGTAPQPPCPRVAMVDEARTVTLYREGPGRDLTDVRYEGAITGLSPVCEYDLEEGVVTVDLDVRLAFSRGPAADKNVGEFPYFVAIADPKDRVIAKRVFTVAPEFPTGIMRIGVVEQLTQEIRYKPAADASAFRIFVGFQLTRAQLEEKRRQRP